jgi:hypothetical protein
LSTSSRELTAAASAAGETLQATVHDTKETVQATVEEVRQYLDKGTETVRDKAEQATLRAKSLTRHALAKLAPPVAGRIGGLREAVRQRPVPAATVALGALVLLLRRLLRRNR